MIDNSRLKVYVAAELLRHRQSLQEAKVKGSILDSDTVVALSQILVGCRLILDRIMNTIWLNHADRHQLAGKPNIYFPCRDIETDFTKDLKRYQLTDLVFKSSRCYELLRSVQPFMGANNQWLQELFTLTKDKHEFYIEIISSSQSQIQIGLGQTGTIKKLVIRNEGNIFADANMRNSLSGQNESLRLKFCERILHSLKKTNQDPLIFCEQCIAHVDSIFQSIFEAL